MVHEEGPATLGLPWGQSWGLQPCVAEQSCTQSSFPHSPPLQGLPADQALPAPRGQGQARVRDPRRNPGCPAISLLPAGDQPFLLGGLGVLVVPVVEIP